MSVVSVLNQHHLLVLYFFLLSATTEKFAEVRKEQPANVVSAHANPVGLVISVTAQPPIPRALLQEPNKLALVMDSVNVVVASVEPTSMDHSVRLVQPLATLCVPTTNHAYDAIWNVEQAEPAINYTNCAVLQITQNF